MGNIVFIGSSKESLDYIEAIQLNLRHENNITTVCWHQGVFSLANFILNDLLEQLRKSSFGVFFLSKDDCTIIRDQEYMTARDNVIFEMGMYMGFLGNQRTFFIVPTEKNLRFRLPSDLAGINFATYDSSLTKSNMDAIIGPACTEIKRKIREQINTFPYNYVIEKYGLFPEFDSEYNSLFKSAKVITTHFIHSRRWRETNLNNINDFFKRDKVLWNVYLPNIENVNLMDHLKIHFDDGETIISKILDAYIFFNRYKQIYPEKLAIYLYDLYPTYSFYKFDGVIIFSLYPLSFVRRNTPTFKINVEATISEFYSEDILFLNDIIKPISKTKLKTIVNTSKKKFA